MAELPIGPGWRSMGLRSLDPTLASTAHSGRIYTRKPAGSHQRWAFTVRWPSLTRAQAAALRAFVNTQRVGLGRFDVVLPVESVPRGVLGGVPVVRNRSNLLLRSEAFDHAAWSKIGGATITADAEAAPDGQATADHLNLPAGAVSTPYVLQSGSVVGSLAGRTFSLSLWVRRVSGTSALTLRLGQSGFADSAQITVPALNSTWLRVGVATTFDAGTSNTLQSILFRSLLAPADVVAIWGAQLEERATPGPYIATTDAALADQPSTGSVLHTDGWTPDQAGVLLADDMLRVAADNKMYRATADVAADAWGNAAIPIYPPLVATPADGAALTVTSVPVRCMIDGDIREVQFTPPDRYSLELDLVEDWT